MVKLGVLTTISAWVLFIFGFFCLVDGLVALISGLPCWLARLIIGPVALTSGSLLTFLRKRLTNGTT